GLGPRTFAGRRFEIRYMQIILGTTSRRDYRRPRCWKDGRSDCVGPQSAPGSGESNIEGPGPTGPCWRGRSLRTRSELGETIMGEQVTASLRRHLSRADNEN